MKASFFGNQDPRRRDEALWRSWKDGAWPSTFNFKGILKICVMALHLFLLCAFVGPAFAAEEPHKAHTHVSLLSERQQITLGESFDVGVLLKMDPRWHTYWKDPGESGMATSIEWTLPEGFRAGPIRWPKPEVFSTGGIIGYGYHHETLLIVRIQAPEKGYEEGKPIKLSAQVNWLECATLCVPGSTEVSIPLPFAKTSQLASAEVVALFEKYRAHLDEPPSKLETLPENNSQLKSPQSLVGMLFAAFLGGLILNLMPCVLPVIAIKILGFIKQGGGQSHRTRQLGLLFGSGVIVSFWILALCVIVLQKAGDQILWGFQFQQPWFLMVMALVVTGIALNFFGLFEFEAPSSALNIANSLASKKGSIGAFLNGVLATTLATPCTAPFLAPALGFAFSQTALTIFLIFTAVGIGLALPYVVLSTKLTLLKWLPTPGPWMLHFKQAMGFPMLATALWLVWNLNSHDSFGAFLFAGWLIVTAFIVWLVSISLPGKLSFVLISFILVGGVAIKHVSSEINSAKRSGNKIVAAGSRIDWKPYSKEALEEALRTSAPVFIDFTADWCITCQFNKRNALEAANVAKQFKDLGVIALIADLTHHNPEITEALSSFQRVGVPLYVLHPVDRSKPPIVLPDGLLTPQIVLDALERAVK